MDPGRYFARRRTLVAVIAVALNVGVVAYHTAAHERIELGIPTWETAYVSLADILLPFGAVLLAWRRKWAAAGNLLGLSMLLALVFTLAVHFLIEGPHNLSQARDSGFRGTAILLVLTESIALAVAGWLVRVEAPPRANRRMRRRGV